MRNLWAVLLGACVLVCAHAAAATMTEPEAIKAVLTEKTVPADLFAASFLTQVPAAQLTSIRDQIVAPLGAFENADGSNGRYIAHFSHGTVSVFIHLDAQGKIDALLFRNPVVTGGSLDGALKPFGALPGVASYLILENGKAIATYNADRPLGVGSSFKLAVLNALRRQIDAGHKHWSDVVELQPAWKSLPSGVLQSWPDGSKLTLQTLATEMISISDNTAADSLIYIVGRAAVGSFSKRNKPFLTTREMFALKSKTAAALRDEYRKGGTAARMAILAKIDAQPRPDLLSLDLSPAYNDIEWYFTARELCTLMAGVEDLPLMTVNPGVANPSQWKRVAYKGGSDAGVISMTTWLQAKNGKSYCVSATQNDATAAVNESAFETLYAAVLGALSAR